MRKGIILVFLSMIMVFLMGCSAGPGATATVTATVTATKTVTVTPSTTATAAPATSPTQSPPPTSGSSPSSSPTLRTENTRLQANMLVSILERNFPSCRTAVGLTEFNYGVVENNTATLPYDYWIKVGYSESFFYNLQYDDTITTDNKTLVRQQLKSFQESIARAIIAYMPEKKFFGGYYFGGSLPRHYYSWVNYSPADIKTEYEKAFISGFAWYPEIDDKLTR